MTAANRATSGEADPIRPWFEILKAQGEFIGIRFGRIPVNSEAVEWTYLPHTDYDGIGGFAHLLREAGAEVGGLPQITHPAAVSWRSFVRHLPAQFGPRRRLKWRALKQGEACEASAQPPQAVAWHVFSEEETGRIRQACRLSQVSVNSFLLKYLDRAVRPHLADPSAAIPWMIPVNLRGKVCRPSDTGNHSSYVGIRVLASEGVREVHRRIYRRLKAGQHCANWMAYTAGKIASEALKKWLIETDRATSQWSIGSFSNLGLWDPDKTITAEGCLGAWLFAPPVLRSHLIGAGCVTFQGRLSLVLQAHPDLTTLPAVPQEWLRAWVREIELNFSALMPTDPEGLLPRSVDGVSTGGARASADCRAESFP